MPDKSPTFRVRVRGPMACFTRPELKVERVSYEVMTPSAARGVLEAVLWKPAIRWRVERIHVLAPIRFGQIKRNEVNSRLSERSDHASYCADEDRAQRNTLYLRDVDYIVEASFEMTAKAGPEDNMLKFVEMFTRRLAKGQHFHQPYLGCREFAATVEPAPRPEDMPPLNQTLVGLKPLGLILHDLDFENGNRPRFFDARIVDGVISVPPFEEVPA
jgi:CRISPR-associated protein Cas5d